MLYLQRRCIAREDTLLLPAYSLSRECVCRVVAQQRVYITYIHTYNINNAPIIDSALQQAMLCRFTKPL
jgi:hypothetical protein